LAASVHPKPKDTIVDLGTGCGIIPLILAYRHPETRIFGVEIQKELAVLAQENIAANGMEDRIKIFQMDMKKLSINMLPKTADLVVSNPPYRKAQSGRVNPNQQRAQARHEISIILVDLIHTVRKVLRKSGRFMMVYPIDRLADVVSALRSGNLEPKFIRNIHSYRNTEAKLVLVEAVMDGRPGLKAAPPLYIYEPDHSYTEEVQGMFQSD
jgi:tRNA1Val (adenine37-N6)-methyltransferase